MKDERFVTGLEVQFEMYLGDREVLLLLDPNSAEMLTVNPPSESIFHQAQNPPFINHVTTVQKGSPKKPSKRPNTIPKPPRKSPLIR